jgi:hypothetical protein
VLSLSLPRAPSNQQARDCTLARYVLAYDRDGAPCAYGSRRAGELWLEVPNVATFHLRAGDAVVNAAPEESVDAEAVLDAYYGAALPLVVQATRGLEVLHASAVRVPSRGYVAAFCGSSESGKSTVAYGLAARGHGHWGDDAVAFRIDGVHSVTAVGLPFTVKLREGSAAYFGRASDVSEVNEDFEWQSTRLGAVFLLEPSDDSAEPVVVERLSSSDALHALLPNAYRFRPQTDERRRQTMQSYLELVASVPIFRAGFSRGLDRLPEVLDELEERISAPA